MKFHLSVTHLSSRLAAFGLLFGLSQTSFAASLAITGNYRFGSNLFSNLDLARGTPADRGGTSSYLEHRLLLRPDVIIDDRFTLKSELNLLQMGLTAPLNDVPPNFGTSLDGKRSTANGGQIVQVQRAYLEWASDWGIFRFGRQPKDWGLGILYSAGSDPLNDYETIRDRVGFQAMLGNLGINVGYEKESEGLLNGDSDDADTYELSLDYSNPESMLDVGLLYARNVRLPGTSSFNSSHDLSIFSRKRWGDLQLGFEVASISQDHRSNAAGFLGQADYLPGLWNMGLDVAFATAASDATFTFNPNYQPFLLLFHQSLGASRPAAQVRGGSAAASAFGAEGNNGGGMIIKGNLGYGFDNHRYELGSDFGFATLARSSTSSKVLGFETDLHLSQKWYDNFKTHYGLGLLFPGSAFGSNPQVAWGAQIRGTLVF